MDIKYIYLDECYWIDILSGKSRNKDCSKFIQLAENNNKSKKWAFPISIWHLAETKNTFNQEKRHKLAQIQHDYSCGWSIKTFHSVRELEVQCLQNQNRLRQSDVIKHDIANMFGTSSIEIIGEAIFSEGLDVDYKTKQLLKTLLEQRENRYTELAFSFEELDSIKPEMTLHLDSLKNLHIESRLTPYEILLINLRDYYTDEQQRIVLEILLPQIKGLGKLMARDKTVEFSKSLPSFYTGSMLLHEKVCSQEKSKAFDKNDFIDIAFLSVAIPYCDIVVTESYWKHHAKNQRLDEIYDTIILDNLEDLIQYS